MLCPVYFDVTTLLVMVKKNTIIYTSFSSRKQLQKDDKGLLFILIALILNAIAVFTAAYLLPGVVLHSFSTAIVVAIVLGMINAFIRPVILVLTLPINVLTLGFLTLIINAAMVLLASAVVPGFEVVNIWWALAFSVLLAIINAFVNGMTYWR